MAKSNLPVKVKVCGTTRLKDALLAVEYGADAIGFIFYKKSPRYVTATTAKDICAKLPPFVNRVGVFVNETAEKINRIADRCGLDVVQLHGDESPAFCKKIKPRVIKVVRVRDAASLKVMTTQVSCIGLVTLKARCRSKTHEQQEFSCQTNFEHLARS